VCVTSKWRYIYTYHSTRGRWCHPPIATVILSINKPGDITRPRSWCGSPINKVLCVLCKPISSKFFTHTARLPKIIPPLKISLEPTPSWTSPEPVLSLRPPWSLHAIVETSLEPPHRRSWPRSRPLYAPPSSPTSSQWHHHQARDAVDPTPSFLTLVEPSVHSSTFPDPKSWCQWPHRHRPQSRDTVDPWCPWGHVTPGFKIKTRCSSYVCLGSSCHTYG
jgi:hypothetical protein